MNNSDIIAALSLALTAIIFLMQTDDSLLKTKISRKDKVIIVAATALIILLTNNQLFSRLHLTFYFTLNGFYFTPNEWALFIFLFLIGVGLYRLFKPQIFNNNPKVLLTILSRYRSQKKMDKLNTLVLQIMDLPDFRETYAEKLNDSVFNDHHLIEYFCSNYPDLIVEFSNRYPEATINRGEHLYYILNGLFADKSNPIYSEIRQYNSEPVKGSCVIAWKYHTDDFSFAQGMVYETDLPLIHWLTGILQSFPSRLKEDTSIFLAQYKKQMAGNNGSLIGEEYITTSLSRDTVFNVLQLFRILLTELSFTDNRIRHFIDRVLLLQYSAWDFVEKNTVLTEDVHLDNDEYSINEYFLQYLFETYVMLFVINKRIGYAISTQVDDKEDIGWSIKQLFNKLDSLWESNRIGDHSKHYYINRLLELYFDLPEFFEGGYLEDTEETILYYFKESLTDTPYGNASLFRTLFTDVCDRREFYRQNNEHDINLSRAKKLVDYLRPTTTSLESKICDK